MINWFTLLTVELEVKMPEDTAMVGEVTERPESLHKSKETIDVSSKTQELKSCLNDLKTSVKSKKTSNKSKKDNKQKDLISKPEISAKDIICNTKQRNGYTKSDTSDNTHTNRDNENDSIIKEEVNVINGHEADDTDIDEGVENEDREGLLF